MVVDASAIIAILLNEEDAAELIKKLFDARTRLVSAATLLEASTVLIHRREPRGLLALDALIVGLSIQVVGFDQAQVMIAREAYRLYGKGRDRAGLNMGDCFSYALAKHTGEPLLFKGNDFTHTDLVRA